jgi:hypothetical protein
LRPLFEVHVFGPAALIRAVLPHMRARRSGAIVQLSSMGGQLSFAALDAGQTPLRLPLGDDAVDAILHHLDAVRAEIANWEKTARNTRLAD